MFVPLLGGAMHHRAARSDKATAQAGLMARGVSGVMAYAVLGLYLWTRADLMLLIAAGVLLINTVNLIPVWPLDGGIVLRTVTRWQWLAGFVVFSVLAVWLLEEFGVLFVCIVGPAVLALRGKQAAHGTLPLREGVVLVTTYLAVVAFHIGGLVACIWAGRIAL